MTAADARRLALMLALFVAALILTVFATPDGVFNGLDLLALAAWAGFLWAGWRR